MWHGQHSLMSQPVIMIRMAIAMGPISSSPRIRVFGYIDGWQLHDTTISPYLMTQLPGQSFSKEQHYMTLPNFIMIGVAKAGTTSFFHYLDQHPQIFVTPIKATNFFGYEDARSWKWMEEGDPPLLQNFPVRTFEA